MDSALRHQCLIYNGPPSRHLPALAAVTREKLLNNYRCLYLNSPPMVAGIRSYLAALGVDVECELAKANLVLSAERRHLVEGRFEAGRMMKILEDTLDQALSDGYKGLWATGDMTWELGPAAEFEKLLEYEQRLEDFFGKRSELCGICQYHGDTLPRGVMRQGVLTHPATFISETLSRMNPHYVRPELFTPEMATNPELDAMIDNLPS